MKHQRIAILGAGRSGIAVAIAAKQRGAIPTLYDSKSPNELGQTPTRLQNESIKLVPNFNGPFTKETTDILVTSPGVDSRNPLLTNAKNQEVEVIGEIEFAYRIATGPIIAITGTNGKSTTTVMTWLCLNALGQNPILCGNIYGSGFEEIPLTEAAANHPGQPLVAEISSFQLEWIRDFKPKIAAITNIAPDHLNRYDSFAAYAETKKKIYENMGRQDSYVHHNDPMTNPPANAPFRDIQTRITEQEIQLPAFNINLADLPFKEKHNRLNAALAANIAYEFRVSQGQTSTPVEGILKGLQAFHGLAHRMEAAGEREGIHLINNSMCTNPEALIASSRSLNEKQHLIVGGVSKGLDFSPFSGYLQATPHKAYLFGADAEEINLRLGGVWPVFRTMGEAFEAASRAAKSGETITACARMRKSGPVHGFQSSWRRVQAVSQGVAQACQSIFELTIHPFCSLPF